MAQEMGHERQKICLKDSKKTTPMELFKAY